MEIVADTPFVLFQHVAPQPHPLDNRWLERADMQIHTVRTETPERAYRPVIAPAIHDRIGFRSVETRIKAAAGDQYQIADIVVADDPVALVSPRIARPHHPDRIRRLMDHVVVDRRQGELLLEMAVANRQGGVRIRILHAGLYARARRGCIATAGVVAP